MQSLPIEQELQNIGFNTTSRDFTNTGVLFAQLEKLWWTVKNKNYDLIYFSDEQRRYQDYDGISLKLMIEKEDESLIIELRHLNWTSRVDTNIYDPKEVDDRDDEEVPYKN